MGGNVEKVVLREDRVELPGEVLARQWRTPDDHTGIAVFLASLDSDFVTATAIAVDGGYSVQG